MYELCFPGVLLKKEGFGGRRYLYTDRHNNEHVYLCLCVWRRENKYVWPWIVDVCSHQLFKDPEILVRLKS